MTNLLRKRPSSLIVALVWRTSLASLTLVISALLVPGLVHAHGASAAEIAPPVITSGLIGFVCYWIVMLWPAAEQPNASAEGLAQKTAGTSGAIRIKRKPRLRVIESNKQLPGDQTSNRRAINE